MEEAKFSPKEAALKRVVDPIKRRLIGQIEERGLDPTEFQYNWIDKLELGNHGRPVSTVTSMREILKNDPWILDNLPEKEFRKKRNGHSFREPGSRIVYRDDYHKAEIRYHLEFVYGFHTLRGLKDALILELEYKQGEDSH